jgi:large subunit ribosomal protein L4
VVKLNKYNLSGERVGEVEVSEELAQATVNSQLLKDYIVAIRANARQWSASTRDRSEVNHSGQKPHRQKGTGKARQGSLAAPHYKGGGRCFGPRPKFDQHVRINRKERRQAVRSLFGEKIQANHLHVVDLPQFDEPKTKRVADFFKSLELSGRVLILVEAGGDYTNLRRSVANLPKVEINQVANASGYDLLVARDIVLTAGALVELDQRRGKE